jgi:aminoglycoside phosphotransferase
LPEPPDVESFTHGDACLPNFLTDGERVTGIVDLGRGGVAHPAQDWTLALRSMRDNCGARGERLERTLARSAEAAKGIAVHAAAISRMAKVTANG